MFGSIWMKYSAKIVETQERKQDSFYPKNSIKTGTFAGKMNHALNKILVFYDYCRCTIIMWVFNSVKGLPNLNDYI